MPGPRQAPTSPQEKPAQLEQHQSWYSGGNGVSAGREQQQQQQQKHGGGFVSGGRRASLLLPHSPANDVAALTVGHPRRSLQQCFPQQQGPSSISAASSAGGEAMPIADYTDSGDLLRAPSAPASHYGSQHASSSDMRMLSGKGRHSHHYKPPPQAHSYVHSVLPRASGACRQPLPSSPSPPLSTSLLASSGTPKIYRSSKQLSYTAAAPPPAAVAPPSADMATAASSATPYRSISSLYGQPGQPASGRYSAPGIYNSAAAAAPQQHPTSGRSTLQQHSSSTSYSSSSSPSTSSTSPSSLTTNAHVAGRQQPPAKMQYHYYHQPPPQNGMNTYHQHTVHPPPHLPAPQLYSVPRMGHSGDINSKLGQSGSVGSLGLGGSGRPLTAEEKEIKRKVSHSAIEKRRRERTNAVLRELQDIVPGLSKPGKIQKLEILEAAADYIRQLTTSAPESLAVSAARAKQRRNSRHYHRAFFPQDSPILGDYGAASRLGSLPDGAVERPALLSSKTIDEQHLTVTTPASVSSTASNNDDADEGDDDDSADDGTALVESTDACRGSELPPPSDPASMKVTFLLC